MNLISCKEYEEKKSSQDMILIDVREQSEWAAGHIEEAVHIPLKILDLVIEERIPDKKKHIVMCCQAGGRASLAADIVRRRGYEQVSVLDGGYGEYCRMRNS